MFLIVLAAGGLLICSRSGLFGRRMSVRVFFRDLADFVCGFCRLRLGGELAFCRGFDECRVSTRSEEL